MSLLKWLFNSWLFHENWQICTPFQSMRTCKFSSKYELLSDIIDPSPFLWNTCLHPPEGKASMEVEISSIWLLWYSQCLQQGPTYGAHVTNTCIMSEFWSKLRTMGYVFFNIGFVLKPKAVLFRFYLPYNNFVRFSNIRPNRSVQLF